MNAAMLPDCFVSVTSCKCVLQCSDAKKFPQIAREGFAISFFFIWNKQWIEVKQG